MIASSNKASEEDGMRGWSEHISMNLLPTIFISQIAFLKGVSVINRGKYGCD